MAIYKNSVPYGNIVTDGLVLNIDAVNPASYPGTGTTVFDQSPVRTNCTLSTAGTFAARAATHFDQTVTIPSVTTTRGLGQSGTIDFWFQNKVNVPTGGSQITLIGAFNTCFWFYRNPFFSDNVFGIVSYYNVSGGGSNSTSVTGRAFTPNVWYNIVGTLNSNGQFAYYQNGSLWNSGTASNFASWFGWGDPLTIGSALGAGNMGTANMRLYNRFLTPQEVTQNYNALKSRFGY